MHAMVHTVEGRKQHSEADSLLLLCGTQRLSSGHLA